MGLINRPVFQILDPYWVEPLKALLKDHELLEATHTRKTDNNFHTTSQMVVRIRLNGNSLMDEFYINNIESVLRLKSDFSFRDEFEEYVGRDNAIGTTFTGHTILTVDYSDPIAINTDTVLIQELEFILSVIKIGGK